MFKIFKYAFYDLLRSKWLLFYLLFYVLLSAALYLLNHSLDKSILGIFNIIILLTPLVSLVFGIIYYYNNREYIELLLTQPISRKQIFNGLYLALGISLTVCQWLGILIPLSIGGIFTSDELGNLFVLLIGGGFLTFIFSTLALLLGLGNENRLGGFSKSILLWLLLAVIYDGLFLLILLFFSDYPLEYPSISLSLANPIDLTRIFVMLKLDHSSLMGYTGAVFNRFFGSNLGIGLSLSCLVLWVLVPYWFARRKLMRKDF